MLDGLLDRLRGFFRRIFMLPLWLTPLVAVPSFCFVGWTLTHPVPPAVFMLACHLSAYALAITVTAAVRVASYIKKRVPWLRILGKRPTIVNKRILNWLAKWLSILWHLLYAVFRLLAGMLLLSAWMTTMGVYHLFLAAIWFSLLRPALRSTDLLRGWRRYRTCGRQLLAMNPILVSVVFLAITQRGSFHYPGRLIYLMALYAFWSLINASIKLVQVRKIASPRLSASRSVSLVTAMVSMLSLEIALIDRFGGADTAFRQQMIALTGGIVCLTVLAISLYMIHRANGKITG